MVLVLSPWILLSIFSSAGLALAPSVDRIFYTPIHGKTLFSVSAKSLRDFSSSNNLIDASVKDHGMKSSQCDGLTVSEDGILYMTMLQSNSVHSVNIDTLLKLDHSIEEVEKHEIVIAKDERLYWPDTFGWSSDSRGGLLVSSARLEKLFLGDWPKDRVNTALFRIPINVRSYQFALPPSVPEDKNDDSTAFVLSVLVIGFTVIWYCTRTEP
jgi:hypothetical protein|tara:strand:+ start:27 stop:662 length:636 start_codon:yes stop_codon:yes gene_type:complete